MIDQKTIAGQYLVKSQIINKNEEGRGKIYKDMKVPKVKYVKCLWITWYFSQHTLGGMGCGR